MAAIRVVESQADSSTRKLVDTLEEHELLELLLEDSKPSVPEGADALSYLLSTPFRYPPLRHGSRFGRRHERGIWYGSLELRTALAETAFYRFVFIEGSAAFDSDARLVVKLTSFTARVETQRGLDLTRSAFATWQPQLRSKTSYSDTQALGTDMRSAGVEAFVFSSARDPEEGNNVGVFELAAFTEPHHSEDADFECYATRGRVEFFEKTLAPRASRTRFVFERTQFEVEGRLPFPAS